MNPTSQHHRSATSRRRLTAVTTGVAVALAVSVPAYTAYAAGSDTAKAKPVTPTSSRSVSVTPYTPPAAPGDARTPAARRITPSGHFAVQVDRAGKKPADKTWPSASEVFGPAELRQVLPGLTGVAATQCATGNLPGGGSTAKSTTCTLNLRISGEPDDDRSKLMINIRGFGLPQQIGRQWTQDLTRDRARSAERPGLYTFYANKALGVSAAYTDGTTTKVLLQRGEVAGEIWFSGIGFTKLTGDYLSSRRLYRTTVVPSLIQLLGAKLTTTAKATA